MSRENITSEIKTIHANPERDKHLEAFTENQKKFIKLIARIHISIVLKPGK